MSKKIKEAKDFVKGNAILAKYMGGVIVGSFTNNLGSLDKPNIVHDHYLFDMGKTRTMNECYWSDTTMKYHQDWNWLMPVLIKIKSNSPFLTIDETTADNKFMWNLFRLSIFTPIDLAWEYCVEFVKYSNKHFN